MFMYERILIRTRFNCLNYLNPKNEYVMIAGCRTVGVKFTGTVNENNGIWVAVASRLL